MKKSIFLFFAAIMCAISAWAATPTKIYLNAKDWGYSDARYAAYFFDPAKWVDMTKVDGETYIYEVDVPSGYTKVIFCRMNGSKTENKWDNKWNQSGDLTIPTDGKNMFKPDDWDGKTTTWSTYTPPVTHTFAKNSTLYVDFRAITGAKKGANYPKAGSVGIDYSANAGGTVIPVTFTSDVKWAEGTEFIKTDQGDWASIPFKAPSAGQNCAQVAADGKSYTWTTYSEPSVTLSLDKESADAGTEVTVTLTATADNVAGEVNYAFQYSTDNATWNNISSTGNTATQTFAAETRYYKVTMTNGGNTKEATAKFSAIVFHVIGSWDEWTTHNVTVDGNVTLALEAGKTYEYKITDGSWDNHWGNDGTMDRENCTGWSFESSNNAKITTDEAGDYVFNVTRNNEGKVKVSVTYPELVTPIPTYDYYICGSFNSNNPKNAENGMTLDGEVYKATVTLAEGDNTLKVTDGSWDNTWGYSNLGAAYEEVSDAGEYNNIKITLAPEAEKNITVIFNATTGKVTFEGLTLYVAPLTYTVKVPEGTEKCFIAGAMNGWNFQEMTATANANEFTIDIAGARESDGYKYACQASWDYVEKKEDGNDLDANRTWTANDVVAKWGAPVAPVVSTYALMGVGGDWTTGITMTVNPDNADEYVLKAQSISSTDAIKVLETAGSTQTWHSTVDAYSNATFELVDDGFGGKNIVLPAGTYNFYFKKINNEIYIEEVYVRDVTNTYGTICLPYASNSYDGAIFYRVAGKETGKVYLESVTELEAGVPYIFEKTASKIVVARNGDPVATAGSDNGLVGTFTNETEVAAGNYILYNNQLRPSNGSAKVNANRAYLVMEDIVGGQPAQMPGRRYIGMSVQGENEATGFENITAPADKAVKAIVNGQLIIIRGNEKFNAQGQKL